MALNLFFHRVAAAPDGRRRSKHGRCLLLTLATWCTLNIAGCGETVDDRFARQGSISIATYGEENVERIAIAPGRVVGVETNDISQRTIEVWSSAAFPRISIDNGAFNSGQREIDLRWFNFDWRGQIRMSIDSLPASASRSTGCNTAEVLSIDGGVVAGPFSDESLISFREYGNGVALPVVVPPCSRVVLQAVIGPQERSEYRLAVVGPVNHDDEFLSRLIADINGWEAHYTQFLGNLAGFSGETPFSEFALRSAELEAPFGAAIGRDDVRADSSSFQDTFGQTDFVSSIGAVPIVVLDTADEIVSDEQLLIIEALRRNGRHGLGMMYRAPISQSRSAATGLRSDLMSARVHELLESRNILDVFGISSAVSSSREFGTVNYHATSGSGGGNGEYLRVTIKRPDPDVTQCETNSGCADPADCVRGFCLVACVDDSDCQGLRSRCDTDARICRQPCDELDQCRGPGAECDELGMCLELPEVVVHVRSL